MAVVQYVPFGVCFIVLALQLTGFMRKAGSYRYASKKQVPAMPPLCEDSCEEEAKKVADRRSKEGKDCPPVKELAETMRVWVRAFRAEQNRIEWFALSLALIALVHVFVHWTVGVLMAVLYHQASSMYFYGALKGGDGRMAGFNLHVTMLKAMIGLVALGMVHAVALEVFDFDSLAAIGARDIINQYEGAAVGMVKSFFARQPAAAVAGQEL